jgi:hypothetical protein
VVVHRQDGTSLRSVLGYTARARLYGNDESPDRQRGNAVQFFRDGKEITSALGISNDFYAFGVLDQFHNRVHIKATVIQR